MKKVLISIGILMLFGCRGKNTTVAIKVEKGDTVHLKSDKLHSGNGGVVITKNADSSITISADTPQAGYLSSKDWQIWGKIKDTLIDVKGTKWRLAEAPLDLDSPKIDSSVAYVRYNPEIKKWAVWGRDYNFPKDWNWIQRYGGGTLQPDDRPTLYNTKQEAISVCLEYTKNFKRYNKDKAINDKITKGFL